MCPSFITIVLFYSPCSSTKCVKITKQPCHPMISSFVTVSALQHYMVVTRQFPWKHCYDIILVSHVCLYNLSSPTPWNSNHMHDNITTSNCRKLHRAQYFSLAYSFSIFKNWNLKAVFSKFKVLSEEPLSNTRLICTHLNAFFMLNQNIAMKI